MKIQIFPAPTPGIYSKEVGGKDLGGEPEKVQVGPGSTGSIFPVNKQISRCLPETQASVQATRRNISRWSGRIKRIFHPEWH